jgi:hypothetical protein
VFWSMGLEHERRRIPAIADSTRDILRLPLSKEAG